MRYALLLLLPPVFMATGCSIFVAKAGKDLSHIQTRRDVHAEFGQPTAEGVEEGRPFEEFRTRGKIAERFRAGTHSMTLGMTLCLYEFYLFPRELYFLAKGGLVGQTVRVTYYPDGGVSGLRIDGRWYGYDWVRRQEKPANEEPPPDVLTPTVQQLLDAKK